MAFTHYLNRVYQTSGGSVSNIATLSGDAEDARSVALTLPATDVEVVLGIEYAGLKGLYILSTIAATINTNDVAGGSPDDTIAVAANVAYCWTHQDGSANPLSADVTKLYITTVGTGTATMEIRVLQDATP